MASVLSISRSAILPAILTRCAPRLEIHNALSGVSSAGERDIPDGQPEAPGKFSHVRYT